MKEVILLITFALIISLLLNRNQGLEGNNEIFSMFSATSGYFLVGHVTSSFQTKRLLDCALFCSRSADCQSFNFGPVLAGHTRFVCELSNAKENDSPSGLKKRDGYQYYEKRCSDDPCDCDPCYHGGTCKSNTSVSRRYECICPLEIRAMLYTDNRCNFDESLIKVHETHTNVFHAQIGRYNLNYYEARRLCEILMATIASYEQLYKALESGYEHCGYGWLSDGTWRYPVQTYRENCGKSNVSKLVGTTTMRNKTHGGANVYCFRNSTDYN